MTTITVNEKTKAGKSFLEFAKNLPFLKLQETAGLGCPAVKTNVLLQDFEKACKQLKESRTKKTKRKTLTQLMNEK